MNSSAKGNNRSTSNSKRKREHDLRVAGKSYHTQRGKEIPAKMKSNNEVGFQVILLYFLVIGNMFTFGNCLIVCHCLFRICVTVI